MIKPIIEIPVDENVNCEIITNDMIENVWQDHFVITDNGKVFRFDMKNNKCIECNQTLTPKGYSQCRVSLRDEKTNKFIGQKGFRVHRIVAKAFLKNIDGKNEVNHIDGNKLNNNSSNLEYVTRSENMLHAYSLGLEYRLSNEAIIDIFKRASNGESYEKLSKEYNIGIWTVDAIHHPRRSGESRYYKVLNEALGIEGKKFLNESEIIQLFEMFNSGNYSQVELSKYFKVTTQTIYRNLNGMTTLSKNMINKYNLSINHEPG